MKEFQCSANSPLVLKWVLSLKTLSVSFSPPVDHLSFPSNLHFKPKYSKKHNSFIINASTLPSMISNIEARLGSHVSQWPSLNFIIYIPEHFERPLYINGANGGVVDAFLVPQWGGVILYNDVQSADTLDTAVEVVKMEDIMLTIVNQLKLLLGVDQLMEETAFQQINDNPLFVSKWDIDHVLISRAFESVVMATSSLHSLTSLLDNVKNMVISDHIQEEVLTSMEEINQFHKVSSNHMWESACVAAASALKHSEAAFFDPSILALLYFPDDQKYAIYIPLFLPISVPVAVGFIKAVKELKKQSLT